MPVITMGQTLWGAPPAAGGQDSCGSFEVMCPNTVFHASPETAHAYLAGRDGLDAEILDQATAVERDRVSFGFLLSEPA